MFQKNKLYLISFAEGAAVMVAEIGGAKLLAPFFGSSLYVWSAVMAITLGGLASGYFLGGKLSNRLNKENTLLSVLLVAVCCLCIMPYLTAVFLYTAAHFTLIPAVIISVFFLLFPTTICMGATSPLIISILTKEADKSGENSGKIYAISTVGGITATFLCGFYLLPSMGVKWTLILFASILFLVALTLLIKKKERFNHKPLIFFALAFLAYNFKTIPNNRFCIYKSEGILGKLEIRDEPDYYNFDITVRKLLINNIIQTEMNIETKASTSEYIKLINKNLLYLPKGKALVMGLGGGVAANLFHQNGYQVTAVEFDERIIDMAKRFFYLNDSVKTICNDARYFINSSTDKYNIVLFDLFKAEDQPAHVLTIESLEKLKTMLDTNAVVLINTEGYLTGERGKGTQCMLATLKKAGFQLKICTFSENEEQRNLIIVASLHEFKNTLHGELYPLIFTDLATVNTDDKQNLESLAAKASQHFRTAYIQSYILRNF